MSMSLFAFAFIAGGGETRGRSNDERIEGRRIGGKKSV